MIQIALTGGIGCGKTTIVAEFQRLGIPCFMADEAGATLYSDNKFCAEVVSLIGNAIINPNGSINKAALAQIIFDNNDKRQRLNALVHPRVMRQYQEWCSLHSHAPYSIFESAIIYEEHLDHLFDIVIDVFTPLEERIQRLQLRNHTTAEHLMPIIASQMDDTQKMLRADYVILNHEGNPRQRQVEHIHGLLMRQAAQLL